MRERRTKTAERLAVAAWWSSLWQRTETTALVLRDEYGQPTLESIAEVDTLTPAIDEIFLAEARSQRQRVSFAVAVLVLAGVMPVAFSLVGGVSAMAPSIALNTTRCTLGDTGVSVPGRCMFLEDFSGSTLDATKWFTNDDWASGINMSVAGAGPPPELGCVTSNNVSVSGGNLVLNFTPNSRPGGCPRTWSTTAYYNSTWAAAYPVNQATLYDGAVVDQRSFRYTYGHTYIMAKLSGGIGPGPDATLWGTDCQDPAQGGTIGNYVKGLFAHNGPCQFPRTPGSQEFDLFNYSASNGVLNFTSYVDADVGSPPFVGTYPPGTGNNYYGDRWAAAGTPGFTAFLSSAPVSDPAANWHLYESDWRPGPGGTTTMSYYVDGTLYASNTATWVPNDPVYLMFWNIDTVIVDGPSVGAGKQMLVAYAYFVCPPDVPCTWSGAGAL